MPSTGPVPLSVLDLAPLSSGTSAADALRNTIDLARHAERFGYARYWLAEHHLTPGVASAAPAVLIALVADATRRIRVGSGAVQTGHHTPLVIAEQFGTIAHIHPGRIDLGLGRSSARRVGERATGSAAGPSAGRGGTATATAEPSVINGLLIPAPPKVMFNRENLRRQMDLVGYRDGADEDYTDQVRDIQAFIRGEYRTPDGVHLCSPTAEGADLQLWILAASAGDSARTAGELGLPLAANYHVVPSTVLDTVAAYRATFQPSETLDGQRRRDHALSAPPEAKVRGSLTAPHVMVSADVVVADDDETARQLASGYGPWVASIRTGDGAVPYPTPAEAAAYPWTEQSRALVADRLDTQFVGSPETVVRRLRTLRDATGADELLITTITHDHADRVRSYELLAEAWARSAPVPPSAHVPDARRP
ncbi:MsnO8 family LLM class oxidoreductase [Frankia sp. Cppng1_Ct_nod]|uniref:MsnO8 family LLM class oxidoreductase n=1 Tax=Frankia sp. Cppng1_Ct_nod TaxID=2897162 RepID=UPI001041A6C2|nr:MsnO8 family LLM class oxidoreductase [Frankia sp. Cppng1_Ct_nod]